MEQPDTAQVPPDQSDGSRSSRPNRIPVGLALLALVGIVALALAYWMRSQGIGDHDGAALSVGDAAPDFSLPDVTGETVSLQDFRGEKSVLLYFSMGHG